MRKLAFLLAIVAILLVACPKQAATTTSSPFFGGSQGISVRFLENSPPNEVLDQGQLPFDIVLGVENVGEWDINMSSDATFSITGISASDFGKTPADLVKDSLQALFAVRKDPQGNKLPGTQTQVTFPGLSYSGTIAGSVPFTIAANSCYKYGTRATTKLCVRSNLLNPDLKTGCKPSETKQAFSSGAPMHVTNMQESIEGSNKIAFTFTITHSGTGTYHEPGSECNSSLTKKDRIFVQVETKIPGTVECTLQDSSGNPVNSNQGYINVIGGSRIVRCSQQIPQANLGDYETPIDITLIYDYKEQITKQVTVKHVG